MNLHDVRLRKNCQTQKSKYCKISIICVSKKEREREGEKEEGKEIERRGEGEKGRKGERKRDHTYGNRMVNIMY
jgi:hypothetical protein